MDDVDGNWNEAADEEDVTLLNADRDDCNENGEDVTLEVEVRCDPSNCGNDTNGEEVEDPCKGVGLPKVIDGAC